MRRHRGPLLPCAALLSLGFATSAVLGSPATAALPTVAGPKKPAAYSATLETPANFDDDRGGDADADDPAIWVRRDRPAQSIVLGALKNGGLDAYDLHGRVIQHIDVPTAPGDDLAESRFNNVDIVRGTTAGDIAVVTDRGRDRLRSYRINPRGAAAGDRVLTDITAARTARLFSATEAAVEEQATGYGLALWKQRGEVYAVVSRRHTSTLGLFKLRFRADGVSYVRVDTLDLPATFRLSDGTSWSPCDEPGIGPQVEGMVVDGPTGVLYAAQEDVGVWRIPLRRGRPDFGRAQLIDRVREFGRASTYDPATQECEISSTPHPDSGTRLSADAEGLTVVRAARQQPTLIASSQGDSTFVEYTLRGRYLRTFAVVGGVVDSVQHSDGAAVTTEYLGRRFPRGLLVVHDGENTPGQLVDGEARPNTNFKFVPWKGSDRRAH